MIYQKKRFKKVQIFYMNIRKRDILLALLLTIFFISFAVTFTVFFKPLYYFDIKYLGIDEAVNMSVSTIKENYNILINYQSIFFTGELNFPDFIMSESGRIHFEEVKQIFVFLQVLMVVSGIASLPLIYKNYKKKEYDYLKLTSILSLGIPLIIGLIASIDFSWAFTLFHKIVFNNDYWLFDSRTDPIINILPETFFMHAFIMIVVIIIGFSIISYFIYRKKKKEILGV